MKNIIVLFVVFMAGCLASEEDAGINLSKGDEYFEKKEYEVAEYYYEKIPDESPLHDQAEKKLLAIHEIKAEWMDKTVAPDALARLIMVDHSYGVDNVLNIPTHHLIIRNNNKRDIASVKLEFTYYNAADEMIKQLQTTVNIIIKSNDQAECMGVGPGRVGKSFSKSTVEIIGATYQ